MDFLIRSGSKILILCYLIQTYMCNDLTVQIKAGEKDCFYEDFKQNVQVDVDYQVIDGGDLDINFIIFSPDGSHLAQDTSKSEGTKVIHTREAGTHAFCYDNTESSYDKVVYFDIEGAKDEGDDELKDLKFEESTFEADLGSNLKQQIAKLKDHLDNTVHIQNLLRTFEARDRATVENNFTRVNMFSCIQLAVMVSVALVQVIMIRGLFGSGNTKGTKMST